MTKTVIQCGAHKSKVILVHLEAEIWIFMFTDGFLLVLTLCPNLNSVAGPKELMKISAYPKIKPSCCKHHVTFLYQTLPASFALEVLFALSGRRRISFMYRNNAETLPWLYLTRDQGDLDE